MPLPLATKSIKIRKALNLCRSFYFPFEFVISLIYGKTACIKAR